MSESRHCIPVRNLMQMKHIGWKIYFQLKSERKIGIKYSEQFTGTLNSKMRCVKRTSIFGTFHFPVLVERWCLQNE